MASLRLYLIATSSVYAAFCQRTLPVDASTPLSASGNLTDTGGISEFAVSTTKGWLSGITTGPDGNLWFVEQTGNKIGRISPSGIISEFAVPTADSRPSGITAGPDGNIWFTEYGGNKIGRISIS